MAFGFGNAGNSGGGSVSQGPDLTDVQTEALGFLSLAGDAKLRLTSQWSPPPAENASLISIASGQGLVAAAGPDGVVLASTESVRKAFEGPKDGDSETRSFQPQLKLPLPIRIRQLAFTTDEAYLILSAEQGGGLAVYQVQALQQGSTQTAFEIPTNGESLRALVPNPNPDFSDLCAVVTSEGKLLMANMKERNFVSGSNGQILKSQVSCVAWSNKGKQLVAGLGDGTIQQMTPEGTVKAEIPRPPDVEPNYFVSSVVWLENDVFLVFYVSTAEQPPQTRCRLITRHKQDFQFQRLNDPVDPFNSPQTPHHTVVRLKDFPPNLQDLLICSSTATTDIGLFTRSKAPLAPNGPSNVFTMTELADDSRRATLPMGDNMDNPVAIGTALDLSSRDNVYKPIPTDELEQSPGPLPGYWVLNADGVLSVWWIVYSESIREGTTYPGLAAVKGNAPSATQTTPKPAPFGAATPSAFGTPSAAAGAAFGSPSALGSKTSLWATQSPSGGASGPAFGSSSFGMGAASAAPKFGAPAFGAVSTPAFGQSGGLGAKSSPWATAAASSSTPAFGQSAFGSNANNTGGSGGSFGGANAGSTNASGGFANFASKGGFASLGSNNNASGSSIFGSTKSEAPEVSMDTGTSSIFGAPSSKPSASAENVFGSQPFKLTSSFKPDPNAKDEDTSETGSKDEKSMFDWGFKNTIDEATKPAASNPFASGTQSTSFGQLAPSAHVESTTPTSTPAPSKFLSTTSSAPQNKGLFDWQPKTPSGLSGAFGSSASQTPTADPPQVKVEAETPRSLKDVSEAPLPPESTSKATYPIGDSSSSSAANTDASDTKGSSSKAQDAPLPPDFDDDPTPKQAEKQVSREPSPEAVYDAPLPPDPIKNKKAYDAPLPPLPGVATKPASAGAATKSTSAGDAPLPPDPVKQPKAYEAKLPTLPVTKLTSEVPGPGFKFPTNPLPVPSDSDDDDLDEEEEEGEEEEEEEDEDEEGTEAASEGSGVDVAKDLSPSSADNNKTPGFTPQSSFDGLAGSFSTISRPDQERRNLFGELSRGAPVFPQPNPLSPRSPSPVRNAVPTRLLAKEQSRSFSAPGMASQILGASRRQQSGLGSSIVGKEAYVENAIIEQQRKAKAKKEAEETQLLLDEEDDAIQSILRMEMQPTLDLDEFVAHSGVVEPASNSVPAQVEALYRDINAMIDTLGLNARSLAGFIKGHKDLHAREYTRQDFANPDDWTLGGLESIAQIIDEDLYPALERGRVSDMDGKLEECADIQRELIRDRNKQADLKKITASRMDPEQNFANRVLPLSAEQASQQSDLRREYAKFTKLLAEAEENLTMLKAKVVSANSANGKGGPTPTIEAIVRTITKLTSMVEKRSGDVDVLENQMRKLRMNSYGPGSREGSPMTTTPNSKRMSTSVFSPERSMREGTPQRNSILRHSMSASVSSLSGFPQTPPRKKLSGFGDVEKKAVKEKRERRAAVLGKLKGSLQKKGTSVWAVDDID
ncbi:F1F0 ATP synthase subunit e, mitochondrial [Hypoxylon texense]